MCSFQQPSIAGPPLLAQNVGQRPALRGAFHPTLVKQEEGEEDEKKENKNTFPQAGWPASKGDDIFNRHYTARRPINLCKNERLLQQQNAIFYSLFSLLLNEQQSTDRPYFFPRLIFQVKTEKSS